MCDIVTRARYTWDGRRPLNMGNLDQCDKLLLSELAPQGVLGKAPLKSELCLKPAALSCMHTQRMSGSGNAWPVTKEEI